MKNLLLEIEVRALLFMIALLFIGGVIFHIGVSMFSPESGIRQLSKSLRDINNFLESEFL